MGMNEVTKRVGGVRLRVDKGNYRTVANPTTNKSSLIVEYVLNTRVRDKEQYEQLYKKLDGMVVFTGTAKDELIDALGQEIDDRDKVEALLQEKIELLELSGSLKDDTIESLQNQRDSLMEINEKLVNALRPFAAQLSLTL